MTRTHVPVLAGELIDLLDPQPGETAIDCTFGDGGHARLVADRIGPTGTLVCIDRDPAAEERFDSFAREVSCETRFLRMDFADGLDLLLAEGLEVDMAYLDLGVSSMQIDTWERGFSYSYDAPLDMRMDPTQELEAREVGTAAAFLASDLASGITGTTLYVDKGYHAMGMAVSAVEEQGAGSREQGAGSGA